MIRVTLVVGARVEKGAAVATIEAMKTECIVASPYHGIVREVYAVERQDVSPGTPIAAIELIS